MRANDQSRALTSARFTQPESMKTDHYVDDVDVVDGNDAWALFCAAFDGDEEVVRELVAKDLRLVNAEFWYQYPIHNAVRGNHTNIVRILLDAGAEPGRSRFMFNSWHKLVPMAKERGYTEVVEVLESTLAQRYGYSPDFEPLAEAIRSRNRDAIEAILSDTPELAKASDVRGNNAIHWAVMTRQLWLIDRMTDFGANADAERADGKTPLILSLTGDYWYRWRRDLPTTSIREPMVVTGYLLANGAKYVLSAACALGDEEQVAAILRDDLGAANRLDSARVSPLTMAARRGALNIVKMLLERGADPNRPENAAERGAALYEASRGNYLDIARTLLEAGADPSQSYDSSGCCLSIVEHRHGEANAHLEMQALLREYGAVDQDYMLSTDDVRREFENNAASAVEKLAARLWECDDFDLFRRTVEAHPAHVQDFAGGLLNQPGPRTREAIRLLVEHGYDPNRTDWLGKSALHIAAESGNIEAAEALLDAGADIDAIEYEDGGTPLAGAARNGQTAMIRFLLERGADVNAAQGDWAKPLRRATTPNADYPKHKPALPPCSEEVAALLREHGATA